MMHGGGRARARHVSTNDKRLLADKTRGKGASHRRREGIRPPRKDRPINQSFRSVVFY